MESSNEVTLNSSFFWEHTETGLNSESGINVICPGRSADRGLLFLRAPSPQGSQAHPVAAGSACDSSRFDRTMRWGDIVYLELVWSKLQSSKPT